MFSEKLKTLRENANLLQKELACELNVTSQTISGWEIGRTTPDYETLVKIAQYFQVSTDFLLNNNSKQNNLEAKVQIKLFKPVEGQKQFIGILKEFDDTNIIIDVSKKPKSFEKKNIAQIKTVYDWNNKEEEKNEK